MFTVLFLAFLVLGLALRVWLAQRQIHSVMKHRNSVPEAFADTVTLSAHQKAADYTAARVRFGLVNSFVSAAVLIGFTLLGGLNELVVIATKWFSPGSVSHALAVFSLFGIVGFLIELPLDLWRTFKLEASFNFNRTTPSAFATDTFKTVVVSVLLMLPIAALIVWLMQTTGKYWWVWAWASLLIFQLLIMLIYPTVIAPVFNKFTPLPEAELKSRIDALLKRCGFASNGVFVMDGSKRSTHGNAYFTGLSKNKRIVFYDTLLARLNAEQIEAVLAHELGHFKHKHIRKRLFWMSLLSLAGFALLGWVATQSWFYEQLGVNPMLNGSNAALAILLFMLVVPEFMFPLSPIASRLSRKQEFEADAFAVQTTGASALKSALVKLYEDNAATLTPDPLHSAFYDSHPPAPVRIAQLDQLAASRSPV